MSTFQLLPYSTFIKLINCSMIQLAKKLCVRFDITLFGKKKEKTEAESKTSLGARFNFSLNFLNSGSGVIVSPATKVRMQKIRDLVQGNDNVHSSELT